MMTTKRAVTCGQGERFKQANSEEVKMQDPKNVGQSKWMDRSIEEECWHKVQADGDRR